MKKSLLLAVLIAISFSFGFAFKSILTSDVSPITPIGRATGIGGIFFKCKDPKLVREWYATHLGLNTNPYGAVFEFYQGADSTQKAFLQWSPFKETTKYFEPSTKDFMINYRVTNMDALIEQLTKAGVTVCDSIQSVEYGKFVHILDIEGNKLELWEPNDKVYEKMGMDMGLQTTK
jgi:predicted enzyme related to lactoylglutathione lyase